MKTIKTFINAAEAGFAGSLLEAGGIQTLLKGEESFAATPGLASGGIELQVPDEDVEKAMILLRKGFDAADDAAAEEASGEKLESEAPVSSQRAEGGKIPVGVFVAALAALAFLSFVLHQTSEQRRTTPASNTEDADFDGDGHPDHFYVYRDGRTVREEVDRNGDRKVDAWSTFDSQGRVEHAEVDDNFDGRADAWCIYRHGELESWKRDVDFDGVPDTFGTCEYGLAVQSEVRPGDSKIVLRRYLYERGVLREELVDENRDGKFDYKILWDSFGTPSEHMPVDGAKVEAAKER